MKRSRAARRSEAAMAARSLAVRRHQQIENDIAAGMRRGERGDATGRRMQAKLQFLEGQGAVDGHDGSRSSRTKRCAGRPTQGRARSGNSAPGAGRFRAQIDGRRRRGRQDSGSHPIRLRYCQLAPRARQLSTGTRLHRRVGHGERQARRSRATVPRRMKYRPGGRVQRSSAAAFHASQSHGQETFAAGKLIRSIPAAARGEAQR